MAPLSIEIVFDCVDQSETESEIKALSKRYLLLNEMDPRTLDPKYFDEPEEFSNVKDVPAIFTINEKGFSLDGFKILDDIFISQ